MHSIIRWILIRWTVIICIVVVTFTLASYGIANLAFAKAKTANPAQPFIIGFTHIPTGDANLRWTASNHTLAVKMTMSSLVPNSIYSAYIQQGFCNGHSHDSIVFKLGTLGADKSGHATLTSTIPNVLNGMPNPNGWYLDVYHSPQFLSSSLQERVACADISFATYIHPVAPGAPPDNNPVASSTPSTHDQLVHVFLGGSADNNQDVIGNATLSLENNSLTVKISLGLLTPTSKYEAQIYKGSCQAPGPVVFPLNSFTALPNGQGYSTTVLDSVTIPSIPKMPWYINVYKIPSNSSTASQTGIEPFVCGNFSKAVLLPPSPNHNPIQLPRTPLIKGA